MVHVRKSIFKGQTGPKGIHQDGFGPLQRCQEIVWSSEPHLRQ